MRHLQLHRSRTNQPLSIALELHQSPLILYHQDDEDLPLAGPSHLGLTVVLNGPSGPGKKIGGVRLVRRVLLRRKIPKTKSWGSWEELQRDEVQLLGESVIQSKQRLECNLSLPARLPETRQTHYDQIIHTLTAVVQDVAPDYNLSPAQLRREHLQALLAASASASTATLSANAAAESGLAVVQEDEEAVEESFVSRAGRTPGQGLAVCKKVFEVVHCPSAPGDVPLLQCEQMLRLSDSGKVTIKTTSDLFVLGSCLDVSFDFKGLTPDTTIHAITAALVQETCTPVKTELPDLTTLTHPPRLALSRALSRTPSAPTDESAQSANGADNGGRRSRRPMLRRISTMWAALKEKPPTPKSSILDLYTLIAEGTDHDATPGAYLWRGAAARALPTRSPTTSPSSGEANDDEGYLDDSKLQHAIADTGVERYSTRMKLHRRIRLPCEINGAQASSRTLAPYLATVTHRICVDVIYSVLGQDRLGKPLPSPLKGGAASGEGAPRQAKAVIEVGLSPCTITPASIQPPEYFSPTSSAHLSSINAPQEGRRRRWSSTASIRSSRSFETCRSTVVHPPLQVNGKGGALAAAEIPHSRAFCASNGLVLSPKKVFYSEPELASASEVHRRDKAACACLLA